MNKSSKESKSSGGSLAGGNLSGTGGGEGGTPLALTTGWEGMFSDWLINQEYGLNGTGGGHPVGGRDPMDILRGLSGNGGNNNNNNNDGSNVVNPNMFDQLTPQQQQLLTKHLASQRQQNGSGDGTSGGHDVSMLKNLIKAQEAAQLNLLQNLQEGGNENQNMNFKTANQQQQHTNKKNNNSNIGEKDSNKKVGFGSSSSSSSSSSGHGPNKGKNDKNSSSSLNPPTHLPNMPNISNLNNDALGMNLTSQLAAMQNNLQGVPTGFEGALGFRGLPNFAPSNPFSYDTLLNKTGINLSTNIDFDDYDEDEEIDMDMDDEDDSEGGNDGSGRQRKRVKTGSKQMTEEQKLERRERNREHAKRSRVRKKFLLESLQKSVNALQDENNKLKLSIKDHLGEEQAEAVFSSLDTDNMDSLVTADPKSATKILDDPDYTLVKALQTAQQNFVITDPALHDHPIVYASQGFMALTGYKLDQILGRNCRFLQGPDTDPEAVAQVREAIQNGTDCSVCLLNYRADGSTFWNQFFIAALRDSDGAVVNYVGVQCKIRDDVAKEIVATERLKRQQIKMTQEKQGNMR